MKNIVAAVIQLNARSDKSQNIENATKLIKKAAHKGAQLIALPELFNWRGRRKEIPQNCETIPGHTATRKRKDLFNKVI